MQTKDDAISASYFLKYSWEVFSLQGFHTEHDTSVYTSALWMSWSALIKEFSEAQSYPATWQTHGFKPPLTTRKGKGQSPSFPSSYGPWLLMRFIDRPHSGCSALKLTGFGSSPQLDGVKPPIKPHLGLRCPRPCSLEPDFSSWAWLLTENAHALYVLWSFIVCLSQCFGSSRAHFINVFSPNPARQKLVKLVCHRDAPPVPFPGSRPVFCKSSPPGRLLELFLPSSNRWFISWNLSPCSFSRVRFCLWKHLKPHYPRF